MNKKNDLKKDISDAFEIPKEIVLDMPFISLRGNNEAVVENYKGIIEYSSEKIRINTTIGILKFTGSKLAIKCIDLNNIIIIGCISQMEFL
ncbi:hypothetical protein SDC9_142580 [bioreactor metagenome]|uniref:Sporulation protein YqfC n=1 Tax=bioreactor metagenome TaxID=1076179 RepID=A0A645E1I6_9ZZZZ|nr:YabP/YqfC family sporulation protein [Candidatus Metalachnospira sp.]